MSNILKILLQIIFNDGIGSSYKNRNDHIKLNEQLKYNLLLKN